MNDNYPKMRKFPNMSIYRNRLVETAAKVIKHTFFIFAPNQFSSSFAQPLIIVTFNNPKRSNSLKTF